jgi:hypothetical protein
VVLLAAIFFVRVLQRRGRVVTIEQVRRGSEPTP